MRIRRKTFEVVITHASWARAARARAAVRRRRFARALTRAPLIVSCAPSVRRTEPSKGSCTLGVGGVTAHASGAAEKGNDRAGKISAAGTPGPASI